MLFASSSARWFLCSFKLDFIEANKIREEWKRCLCFVDDGCQVVDQLLRAGARCLGKAHTEPIPFKSLFLCEMRCVMCEWTCALVWWNVELRLFEIPKKQERLLVVNILAVRLLSVRLWQILPSL